jgi:hypothetical protein
LQWLSEIYYSSRSLFEKQKSAVLVEDNSATVGRRDLDCIAEAATMAVLERRTWRGQ